MKPLTEEQKELVNRYYYIANITSKKVKTSLYINDRLSAAHDGLMSAAYYWDGKRPFRTYAVGACRKSIIFNTIRQRFGLSNRGKAIKPIKFESTLYHYDHDIPYSNNQLDNLVREEEIGILYSRLDRLTISQRTIIEMYISGMNQITIANLLGLRSQTIQISINRSIRKMKD